MTSNRDYQTQITNLQSENKKLKERLQELEVANRNNEKVIEDCNKLINRNFELQKENKTLLISISLLRKTLDIIVDCITNATELSQLKDDIIYKVTKEVLNEDED